MIDYVMQLAVGLLRLVPQQLIVYLCLIIAVLLQVSPVHACNPGNLGDVLGGTRLGNLNVGFHGQFRISLSKLSMDNFPENPKNRTCPLTQNGAYETKMWLST